MLQDDVLCEDLLYYPHHYDLQCSVFKCNGLFYSERTGLTSNLPMLSHVCVDMNEREETLITRNGKKEFNK